MGGACCDAQGDMRPAQVPSGGLTKPQVGGKIKIEYFFEGPEEWQRPAPLIFLLEHKGVDFERQTVSLADWPGRKESGNTGEMGGLPIVHRGGQSQQQTNAVLRSLGAQYGYYDTKDWKNAGTIDMIVDTQAELYNACAKLALFTPEDDQPQGIEDIRDGILTKFMTIVEKRLAGNGNAKFIVGDKLTIADFAMCQTIFNILRNTQSPLHAPLGLTLDSYPLVEAYATRLEAEVQAYLTKRSA